MVLRREHGGNCAAVKQLGGDRVGEPDSREDASEQQAHEDSSTARQATAVTLDLVRYRHIDGDEDWLYLGDGQQGLDLSLESARRLAAALTAYLTTLA